ncbi:MAG: endonuclease/exonuclease/phosphatase family metal-dependent hydrolase [Candidatus Azotimanducaceae bacterium]|jgi:endonuclease/exonuclease/phosphatase family metal-dependent hydrolase
MVGSQTVRILTLNIAHGRGLSAYQGFVSARGIQRCLGRVAHLLKKVDADIVALQEVDEDSHWNQGIHLLDSLKAQTGYPHSYLGVHNRREGKLPLAYGNGLLTKFPIKHAEHTAFGRASLGEKGFMCAELETPQGILPVINLHLDFRSRLRRIEQVEHLIQFFDDKKYTVEGTPHLSPIICGDFNSRSGKPADAVRHLFNYLQHQCEYTLLPTGRKSRTFPSLLPVHGLDFVFVPPSYQVCSSEVLRSYVSDHRPVLVELGIRN